MNLPLYSSIISASLQTIDTFQLESIIQKIEDTDELILVCGNGGSHSLASHFTQDLNKALGKKAICAGDAVPFILATANDKEYSDVFLDTYTNFKHMIKLVIVISGSGNSENIIKLLENVECQAFAFVGFDGGKAMNLASKAVHIELSDMRMVESAIDIVLHYIIERIENGC